jgi:hypothetical protein
LECAAGTVAEGVGFVRSIASRVLRPLIVIAALLALWPASAFAALSYPVNAVGFYDADTGYLAGGSGSSGFVSATGDGGATWHSSIATNRFMFSVAASLDSGAAMALSLIHISEPTRPY